MSMIWRPGYTWNETIWNPSMISTALWLDAADSGTITTVSNAVSEWADKSGNDNHFSQTTSTSRPTLDNSGVNGKPALVFDGVNDSLAAGSALIGTTHSLFILFTPTIEAVTGVLIGQWQSGETGRFLLATNQDCGGITSLSRLNAFNSTTTQGACSKGGSAGFAIDASIANTPTIIESICTTGSENWKLLKDGTEYESASVTAVFQGVATALGTTSAIGNSLYYDGLISEVILTDSVASTDTRQRIEGYLVHKWGLTANLPTSHPYKIYGPTP